MTSGSPYVSPFRTFTNIAGACYYYSMSAFCAIREWWTEATLKEMNASETVVSPSSRQSPINSPTPTTSQIHEHVTATAKPKTVPPKFHSLEERLLSPLRRRGLICSAIGTLCLTRGVFDHLLDTVPIVVLLLDLTEIAIVTFLLTWDITYKRMTPSTFFKIGSWFWTSFFISTLGITSPVSKLDTRILQIAMGGISLATYFQLLVQAHGGSQDLCDMQQSTTPGESTSKVISKWNRRRTIAFLRYIVYALISSVYIVTWAIGPNCAGLVTHVWHIELCRLAFHVPLLTVATWLSVCSAQGCA